MVPLLFSLEDHDFHTEFQVLIHLTTEQFCTLSQSVLNELCFLDHVPMWLLLNDEYLADCSNSAHLYF